MTWHNKVMWTEGMFLQPQHFQQQDRFSARQLDGRWRATTPWPWGYATLQLDECSPAPAGTQLTPFWDACMANLVAVPVCVLLGTLAFGYGWVRRDSRWTQRGVCLAYLNVALVVALGLFALLVR